MIILASEYVVIFVLICTGGSILQSKESYGDEQAENEGFRLPTNPKQSPSSFAEQSEANRSQGSGAHCSKFWHKLALIAISVRSIYVAFSSTIKKFPLCFILWHVNMVLTPLIINNSIWLHPTAMLNLFALTS